MRLLLVRSTICINLITFLIIPSIAIDEVYVAHFSAYEEIHLLSTFPTLKPTARAFTGVQQIESDAIKAGLSTPKDLLSPQQLLDWWVT